MAVGAALAFAAANVRAQETTQADKDKALAYLESTKKGVLDATKGLSEAQWNFKPAPDKWSVAECVEHIAAAEDFIRGMAVDKVMKAPAAPDRDIAKIDAGIMAMIPDGSQKAQAPDELKPTNRFGSPEGSLKTFCGEPYRNREFPEGYSGSPRSCGGHSDRLVIPSEVSKWRAPVKFSDCRSLNRLKRPCPER